MQYLPTAKTNEEQLEHFKTTMKGFLTPDQESFIRAFLAANKSRPSGNEYDKASCALGELPIPKKPSVIVGCVKRPSKDALGSATPFEFTLLPNFKRDNVPCGLILYPCYDSAGTQRLINAGTMVLAMLWNSWK